MANGAAAQDHGKTCLIALAITVLGVSCTGAMLLVAGLPTRTTDAVFYGAASLLGFAFCAGQGAAVTGFLAMKQKQNTLYVLPALLGAVLGVGAFLALFGFSVLLGFQQANPAFR